MYARVITTQARLGTKVQDQQRVVEQELLPLMRQQPGFRGYFAINDASGKVIQISLWDSEADNYAFGSQRLVQEVRQVLQRHELAPSRLVLEVSENAGTRDADAAIAVLRAVAALGVGISIDDFGTGFSSLLQLRRLPATEIKIDRAFVMALEDSDEDVVVVSAIVALGHALDMEVVAKGIETPGQRTYAERLGCDHLQGYQLGRPVGPESFMRLYASGGL